MDVDDDCVVALSSVSIPLDRSSSHDEPDSKTEENKEKMDHTQ